MDKLLRERIVSQRFREKVTKGALRELERDVQDDQLVLNLRLGGDLQ